VQFSFYCYSGSAILRLGIAIDFGFDKTIFIIPHNLYVEYGRLTVPQYPYASLLALQDYLTPDFNDKVTIGQYMKAVENLEEILMGTNRVVLSCNHGRTRSVIIALSVVARCQGCRFNYDSEIVVLSALFKYHVRKDLYLEFMPERINLWKNFICGVI
jgi:hypothetical protein